ncbi:hypothetical protein M0638_19790 [Roseomonas sp. NAR14]|uniref:Uncharacterized protein n=1 Tax=Roseomonas acroporae TaxID=2937791 RepID=A0A9X1YAM1_9PROT|nr:hypothetical protein [Roseomonas acroporae]MCK8786621.1 hypothetical protein [Roseomonas acroporae]
MELSPEQRGAAEACGCVMLPATDDQIARLTMQRRIFSVDGRPCLITRHGSGFYETHGTLSAILAAAPHRTTARNAAEAPPAFAPEPSPRAEAAEAEAEAAADLLAEVEASGGNEGSKVRMIKRRTSQPRTPRWSNAGAERRGRMK